MHYLTEANKGNEEGNEEVSHPEKRQYPGQ
jgi:hypothetical protein